MLPLRQLYGRQASRKFFSTYKIYQSRVIKEGESNINVYNSSIQESKLDAFQNEYKPFLEYFQLLPFFFEKFVYGQPKNFITKMEYFKDSDILKLTCLTHSGIYSKLVYPENIIPVTYADYANSAKRSLFKLNSVLDHEMIYFNTFQNEFYVFDTKGRWNNEEIEGLSLDRLWNERKFQDRYFQ